MTPIVSAGTSLRVDTSQRRSVLALLSCVLLTSVMLLPVETSVAQDAAQDTAPEADVKAKRFTFAFLGVPMQRALEVLIQETSISLIFQSELVGDRTAYCRIEQAEIDAVLRCVLHPAQLDFVRLSSGTYVVTQRTRRSAEYANLLGSVVDATNGTPLADATVRLVDAGLGTSTNRDGRFAFARLEPGPHRLVVSHVAYHALVDSIVVGPHEAPVVGVELRPRVVLATPVVVSGFEARRPSDDLGVAGLNDTDLDVAPTPDASGVLAGIASVEGVRIGDALSDIHVQGGAANEQLFLLDGVPVFVPVANGGFIGPFSPFAVQRITVRKAGFGVAYGSNLSGVIEVDQHVAPTGQERLTMQLDPLSANVRWTGRARLSATATGSWMLAARKSLWDLYQPRPLESLFQGWSSLDRFLVENLLPDSLAAGVLPVESAKTAVAVNYSDVHAGALVSLGRLRSLRFSFYDGRNDFGIEDGTTTDPDGTVREDVFEDAYRWRNRVARLRYEWVQSSRLFATAEAWFSAYRLFHPTTIDLTSGVSRDSVSTIRDFNDIDKSGLRLGGEFAANATHMASFGIEVAVADGDFSLSIAPDGSQPFGPSDIRPIRWTASGFAQDRISVSPYLVVISGLLATYVPAKDKVYLEPRVSAQVDADVGATGAVAARFAVGLYRQYLYSVDVATYNITSLLPRVRFWLPIGRDQSPPEAYHTTLSVAYSPVQRVEFGVEGYHKYQPSVLVLDYAQPGSRVELSSDPLIGARGFAYGFSLGVKYRADHLSARAQYDFSEARQRIPNRFGGRYAPVPWDVPHAVTLAVDAIVYRGVSVSVRWQGLFGRMWGFRQAYYDFLESGGQATAFAPFDLSRPEDHRLPAFRQLDLGASFNTTVASTDVQFRVMLVNVLGRQNETDWSLTPANTGQTFETRPRLAASFVPSFSVRVSPW